MRNILKDAQVKSATSRDKPYRLADGEGLCLLLNKLTKDNKPGSKSWQYRYRVDGKSRIFTIGKYPAITLKAARERHLKAQELVSDGICPCENKQIQKLKKKQELETLKQANKVAVEHNFEAVAREWYKDTKHEWRNQKHVLLRHLKKHGFTVATVSWCFLVVVLTRSQSATTRYCSAYIKPLIIVDA